MTALLWLIPIALTLGLLGLCAFFWSLRTRQFEDPLGDASRILNSEDRPIVDPKIPDPKESSEPKSDDDP